MSSSQSGDTVAQVSRTCARPGCGQQAVATLSYAYGDGMVFLEELAAESHPMVHDLCDLHAAKVSVPRGWKLQDQRGEGASEGDVVQDGSLGALRLVGA